MDLTVQLAVVIAVAIPLANGLVSWGVMRRANNGMMADIQEIKQQLARIADAQGEHRERIARLEADRHATHRWLKSIEESVKATS